jgi:hypothetical protein
MARSIADIQAQIIATIAANNDLTYQDENNITRNITYNTSKRAIWRAWTYVVAVCIAILEQLMDVYVSNIETLVARSPAASRLWIQNKMFEFQYDAANPQVLQLINTIPTYPVVDATKRIITACSVTSDIANNVNVKVAKSSPFVALTTQEKSAAQAYIDTVGDAGITYNVISLTADKISIEANIYYQGQYSSIIANSVITALNSYFQNLSIVNFDGSLKMSDLENAIRTVTGVNDVELITVIGRPDTIAYGGGTYCIQNKTLLSRIYNPTAGYMVQETTSGHTFTDTLNFIAQ